jgi:PBS lyase HEAT-like repeat
MLRSSRIAASLIRSLVLGTAATTTTVLVSATLVGCKDESQPEYWTDKLSDQAWRARAVKRLEQFFEDSMTKNGNDLAAAPVQDLVGKTVGPLTTSYIEAYDQMDTKTRVALIKLLASYRDKRTEPALKKAFDDFAKKPKTSKDEQDIKWAARATGDLKLDSLAVPMLEAFMKLRTSSMLGGVVYKDLNEAMVSMPSKSWVGPLTTKLEAEIVAPKGDKDKDLFDPFRDQLFWQTTAAELLGRIGDPAAVQPLMKVMLDPAKVDIQATAILALVKLGKPTVDAASKLLTAPDSDPLVAFFNRRVKDLTNNAPKNSPHVQTAALILGTVGHPGGAKPLIAALSTEKDDSNKAVIARELAKIPATPDSKQAFKTAFESLPLDATVPPGGNALEQLAESASRFYDPDLVGWLLDRADGLKGNDDDKKAVQSAIVVTALKLAKANQIGQVKVAVNKYGTQIEKDALALAEKELKACGDRAACYLAAIQKQENQEPKTQFAAIKDGYMIAILGGDSNELVAALDKIDNAAIRFVAANVVDFLSPKGSKPLSEKLNSIIQKNAKSADRDKAAGDSALKQVMYRLDARGG